MPRARFTRQVSFASSAALVGATVAACTGQLYEVCAPGDTACIERQPINDACTEGGKTRRIGEMFLSSDGCNMCACGADGVGCTTKACVDAGRWQSCCENGRVAQCFCPEGAACNYGWFENCGDGTCRDGPAIDGGGCGSRDAGKDARDSGKDAGGYDAGGGFMERCCKNGRVDQCFCPGGMACNYGWFTDCGNGACIDRPAADAAACFLDAGGGG